MRGRCTRAKPAWDSRPMLSRVGSGPHRGMDPKKKRGDDGPKPPGPSPEAELAPAIYQSRYIV